MIKELESIRWFDWDVEKIINERERLENLVKFDMLHYYESYNKRKPDIKNDKEKR